MAEHNGFGDVIQLVRGNFGEVELPEPADVLVTETFGAWALAEGAASELDRCIQRNLKTDGKSFPATSKCMHSDCQRDQNLAVSI